MYGRNEILCCRLRHKPTESGCTKNNIIYYLRAGLNTISYMHIHT